MIRCNLYQIKPEKKPEKNQFSKMTPARYQLKKTGRDTSQKKPGEKHGTTIRKKSYFIRCSRTRHREKKAFITYVFLFYGTEKAKKARL